MEKSNAGIGYLWTGAFLIVALSSGYFNEGFNSIDVLMVVIAFAIWPTRLVFYGRPFTKVIGILLALILAATLKMSGWV